MSGVQVGKWEERKVSSHIFRFQLIKFPLPSLFYSVLQPYITDKIISYENLERHKEHLYLHRKAYSKCKQSKSVCETSEDL